MATVERQFFVKFPEDPASLRDLIDDLTGIIPWQMQGKDKYGNDTFLLGDGKVRISTALCIVDIQDNLLVWGRPAGMQENTNNALDIFGAVAFNNISLLNKLPSEFLGTALIDYIMCPGVAIEQSDTEDVIMCVWIAIVDSTTLGVIPEKSFVINADDLRADTRPKTAKLELALANL